MSRIPPAELAIAEERAGGYCEAGGLALGDNYARHHRQLRSSGGKGDLDVAANLLLCHHQCHTQIHANPRRSYALGHMVQAAEDFNEIPVQHLPGLCALSGAIQ